MTADNKFKQAANFIILNALIVLQIYVVDQYCGGIAYLAGKYSYTIYCNNKVGNSIKVIQRSDNLMLCEVEAYGFVSGLSFKQYCTFITL